MSEVDSRKVVLSWVHADSDEAEIETPWADYLGDDLYQLKNYPFSYYGISYDDIFEAKCIHEDDERPYLTKVVKKSGHKTVRVIFENSIKDSQIGLGILEHVSSLGCGYEGNGAKFFVINIQPHVDFWQICNYLTDNNVNWEHADPTYEEVWPDENT